MAKYNAAFAGRIRELDIEALGGDMAEDLIRLLNKATRYSVKKWWSARRFNKFSKETYIPFKYASERELTAIAHVTRLLATMLRMDIYDSEYVGATRQSAQDKCLKMLRSLSRWHASNFAGGWHIISVTSEIAVAGALMWDKLTDTDKEMTLNMLESEAETIYDKRIPYQHSASIVEESSEICKARIATDYAKLMTLASCIMPLHHSQKKWAKRAEELLYAAFSCKTAKAKGWNTEENGLLYSKGIIDVEMMSYAIHAADALVINRLFDKKTDEKTVENIKRVYSAFNNVYISRQGKSWETVYRVESNGALKANVNIPAGSRANRNRIANYYCFDVMAYCFDLDEGNDYSARDWARVRMRAMLKGGSQEDKREERKGERTASEKEPWIGQVTAMAYLALFMKASGALEE